MKSLDEQIGLLEDELREWDGTNLHERARLTERYWRLRVQRDEEEGRETGVPLEDI